MVMKYTVYRTVNLLNGKFYFGVHKTKNPNDEYLGSGTYIKQAVAKHGEQNFRKDVLFIYLDAESAFGKEDELIQCWRSDPLCMNLRKGGSGGFDYINREGFSGAKSGGAAANPKLQQWLKNHPEHLQQLKQLSQDGYQRFKATQGGSRILEGAKRGAAIWKGQTHDEEARHKIRMKQTGSGNSQFGTCWVTKDGINRKVQRTEISTVKELGWVAGRE